MKYTLVAIKDNAAQAFQPINSVRAQGEATRSFMDAINDTNNRQLNQHPEDFDLYYIGTFDDDSGELSTEKPKLITRGVDVKIK